MAGQESVDPVVVLVKEAMDVEWEHMRAENANLPQLTPRRPSKKRTALSANLMDTMAPGGSKRLQCYAGPSQQCNVFGDSDEVSGEGGREECGREEGWEGGGREGGMGGREGGRGRERGMGGGGRERDINFVFNTDFFSNALCIS